MRFNRLANISKIVYSKTLNIRLLLIFAHLVHSTAYIATDSFFILFFYGSLTEKKIPSHKIAIRYISTRLYYVIIKNKLKYYQLIKATYLHTRFFFPKYKIPQTTWAPGTGVEEKLVLHKHAGNRLDQVTQVNFCLISHL